MSVAFRRESDEEHLEPRFELPLPRGPNPVTPRGARLIEEKVAALEAARAGVEGEALKDLARNLRYWRARLASAEIIEPRASEEAVFGSRVRFRMGRKTRTLDIVGHDEADGDETRIAVSAPLARALLGGAAGDRLDFADREGAIEILEVGVARDA